MCVCVFVFQRVVCKRVFECVFTVYVADNVRQREREFVLDNVRVCVSVHKREREGLIDNVCG